MALAQRRDWLVLPDGSVTGLRRLEKTVLAVLAGYLSADRHDASGAACWPSVEAVGGRAGYSKSSVFQALDALEARRLIYRQHVFYKAEAALGAPERAPSRYIFNPTVLDAAARKSRLRADRRGRVEWPGWDEFSRRSKAPIFIERVQKLEFHE